MIEYSNILAVVEPERENQPAISRAIELAEKTGTISYEVLSRINPLLERRLT